VIALSDPNPTTPGAQVVPLVLRLAARTVRVEGVPTNWLEHVPRKLLRRKASGAAKVDLVARIGLTDRNELRASPGPHDLNETFRLKSSPENVSFRFAGCEGRFDAGLREPMAVSCHYAAAALFGSIVENMLRVLIAYDVLNRGGVMLHSAAIVRDRVAAALFGHSGAGKSTVSELALAAGCSVVSDDINLIEPCGDAWCVTPVPFSGTLGLASDLDEPIPLHGLFRLLKSDRDGLRPCSPGQSVALLSGCAPFVNRDVHRAGQLMKVLVALSASLPVRGLEFTRGPSFLDLVFGETR
jgi:hypothetical protein